MKFIILRTHHVGCGPQHSPVTYATIRCYLVVKLPVNDIANFEAFDIPTSNLGEDLLPDGTVLEINICK